MNGVRLAAFCIAGALSFATRRAGAEAPVCRDLSATWDTVCCATDAELRCAPVRAGQDIVAALNAARPSAQVVRSVASVGYGVCVLNEDRSVVCWPGSKHPWKAPGVEATDLAAATEPSYSRGAAFCVNAIGQGVLCYRAKGPVPLFVGKTDVEMQSLTVNDLQVCGIASGVPRCFSIPGEKRDQGMLPEGKPWTGYSASSPAIAVSSNERAQACALRGSEVRCHLLLMGTTVEKTLPAPGVALAVGRAVVCVVLATKDSITCWHPGTGAEELQVDELPEGSGTIEGVVGTHHGACFLRTGGLVCLNERRLNDPPEKAPPAAIVAAAPKAAPPPRRPIQPAPTPEEERPLTFYAALPFSFGHGHYKSNSGSASGLWLNLRAVLAIGRYETLRRRGWAIGPYFDLGWHPVTGSERMTSFGAGATAIWSITKAFGVVPSVGWFSQDYPGGSREDGLSAGLFVGAIQDTFGPLYLPIGVRLETRMGFGDQRERSTLFGGEIDAIIPAAVPVIIIMWARSSYDWT